MATTENEKKKKMVMIIDPPSGWKYGFPRPIPEECRDGDRFYSWLEECGYPRKLIEDFGDRFYCRFWEEEVEENI